MLLFMYVSKYVCFHLPVHNRFRLVFSSNCSFSRTSTFVSCMTYRWSQITWQSQANNLDSDCCLIKDTDCVFTIGTQSIHCRTLTKRDMFMLIHTPNTTFKINDN